MKTDGDTDAQSGRMVGEKSGLALADTVFFLRQKKLLPKKFAFRRKSRVKQVHPRDSLKDTCEQHLKRFIWQKTNLEAASLLKNSFSSRYQQLTAGTPLLFHFWTSPFYCKKSDNQSKKCEAACDQRNR